MVKPILIILMFAGVASAQILPGDFIADFESGNITDVQLVGVDSFTVRIRPDIVPGDTYGWFYFAIVNNPGRTATIFLVNPDGWQNGDCKPVFSNNNGSWGRISEAWSQNGWLCFRQYLNSDTVWFAQGFPFTVSLMTTFLDSFSHSDIMQKYIIGYSPHDRPIELASFTNFAFPAERKKNVWLISRQHPMESGPSFAITALVDRIVEGDRFGENFLRDINLTIVPIVNVDGVAEGYSRQNVNGINLNRNWGPDLENEQPEVRAVHGSIEQFLSNGNDIDLFMDLHSAPDNYDFGYRMSLSYTSAPYFNSQETYLHLLETSDPWQDRTRWRDLDTSYAFGVSCVVVYDMYALDAFSAESPWTRRDNGDFITMQSLYNQGTPLAEAIYDYLYPLTVFDTNENEIDSIVPGQPFIPSVLDFDQRNHGSVEIIAHCVATSDSEQVTCYRQDLDGIFEPFDPIPTNDLQAVPGDGIMTIAPGSEMIVSYVEPDMLERVYRRFIAVEPSLYIADDDPSLPRIELSAYPNPFNSSTIISYSGLDGEQIRIFDIMGREIRTFKTDSSGAIIWNAKDDGRKEIVSGIYFVSTDSPRAGAIKLLYLK